ncbi:MAG: RIP metalloprotease RseP [Kangiellaceae bacterium]|nr:RIP metalloprotease RseP [Kangiellaceae bacterium]
MDILWNFASFVVALGVLVTIHEYGHFIVARKLGVKVLTFSVGFGKPLFQKVGKDGVRYVIAAIPLGGYVKMLGEQTDEDQEFSVEDQKRAFNRQSVWTRMAIVLAGPIANFLLAIVLYWIIFLSGTSALTPVIAEPTPDSIAQSAGLKRGDEIRSVDGVETKFFQDVSLALASRLGEKTTINMLIVSEGEFEEKTVLLDISNWQVDDQRPDVIKSLGLAHRIEMSIISEVEPDSAADKAGLNKNDQIIVVDGIKVTSWRQMSSLLSERPNKETEIEVIRNDELIAIPVVIGSREHNGQTIGKLGISREIEGFIVKREPGIIEAVEMAFDKTVRMIELTVRFFKKFLFGEISHKSLSGPLAIAEGAGSSAAIGVISFLGFLAMISVNLGFINLLPVPMLDGGHFLYYVIEVIRGKPLSDRVQGMGLQIGMMLVFALMAIAIYNDVSRF